MFKNYRKMSDKQLIEQAHRYHLRGFMEETLIITKGRKFDTDFVINRRDVIDQLLQKDNRNIAFGSAIVAVLGAIISLSANFF